MSAECEAFVEKHSPYKRDTFSIHLRLAMIANEAYGYRIFASEKKLCELCRCSPKTLQRAKKQLIADGYLKLVFPAQGRHVAEYQFMMPGIAGHSGGAIARIAGHPVRNSRSLATITPLYINKDKESEESVSDEVFREHIKSIKSQLGAIQ